MTQVCRSSLTQSDYDFLGLPLPLAPGMAIFMIGLIQEVARLTCPYHLRRLALSDAVTSGIPSFPYSVSVSTPSSGLTLQIQWAIALSFLRSRCREEADGAHASLPCNMADRTQALNTLPRVLRETCFDVSIGSSFLNFPQAVQHLVMMASSQPPPAHSVSPR
ncbi:hypothetical protein DPMN_170480 [Dreissena polymorpha]|uniref:Uncharacterized protein n=1 Tax=Dreissena polymorpha TaxID=45954 RepID=A0A9D4DX45_DREPO|nr:hypothetical protein DPMN_170480 [Dreissena polymorpha]